MLLLCLVNSIVRILIEQALKGVLVNVGVELAVDVKVLGVGIADDIIEISCVF